MIERASRCPRASSGGREMRQASSSSAIRPRPSTTSSTCTVIKVAGEVNKPTAALGQTRANSPTSSASTHSPAQIRSTDPTHPPVPGRDLRGAGQQQGHGQEGQPPTQLDPVAALTGAPKGHLDVTHVGRGAIRHLRPLGLQGGRV